jgi:hypothetical protein
MVQLAVLLIIYVNKLQGNLKLGIVLVFWFGSIVALFVIGAAGLLLLVWLICTLSVLLLMSFLLFLEIGINMFFLVLAVC